MVIMEATTTGAIGATPDWLSDWEYWAVMAWVTTAEDPTIRLITATDHLTVMHPTAIRLTGFPPGMATPPATRIHLWRQWL
jgi:hypothetical protein